MRPEILRQRLRRVPDPFPSKSDRELNPGWPLPAQLRPAAVLVPLIFLPQKNSVLLTLRQPHLSEHAGQVSFPGGRIDPSDPGPAQAALREAQEEIGLWPDLVEQIGWLDTYVTFTGYQVMPLVGIVRELPRWQLSENEVAEVFELPLEVLLAPDAFMVREFRVPSGVGRRTYTLSWQGREIWGATAAMLVNLRELLKHED